MRVIGRYSRALLAALVIAGALAAAPTSAAAAGQDQANLTNFCAKLADAITYLESLQPSALRDRLLAKAEWTYSQYCQ
jgi:hypothetical protein